MVVTTVNTIFTIDFAQADAIWEAYDEWKGGSSSIIADLLSDVKNMVDIRNISIKSKKELNKW